MELLWLLLIALIMIVYPVVVLRSAAKGRRWALDTLECMRYASGDLMSSSAWRALPRDTDRPGRPRPEASPEAEPVDTGGGPAPETPGRLVA